MRIPTKEQCYELFRKYKTPDNVIKHSEAVNKVAVFLASRLKEAGIDINVGIVNAASLLHDIARLEKPHSKVGAEILRKEGFPEVAKCVETHGYSSISILESWEQKVVHYADKRATNKTVSLKERAAGWMKKYPDDIESIKEHGLKTEELEKQIFNKLSIKPNDLKEMVK